MRMNQMDNIVVDNTKNNERQLELTLLNNFKKNEEKEVKQEHK